MAKPSETLLDWLRDAHAMEEHAEQMLSSTAQRLRDYPEFQAKLDQHLLESRGQALRVRRCIERLGSSTSILKDVTGKVVAFGQGISGLFVSDAPVKAALATWTFEQMEIASYRILIAAADQVGDAQTRQICEENLREEEAMAGWLADYLPTVAREFLVRSDRAA